MEMDNRQSFSQEMMIRAMFNKVNEHSDILSLLLDNAADTEEGLATISSGIRDLKHTTELIKANLDVVLQKLDVIEETFAELKQETREVEQKLLLMSTKLDKMEKEIGDEEIEDYYILCQSLYNNWDELDELTRRLIPVAEYLFSKLQKYDKPDFSPVILELCRAIENEFLLKIFRKYTLDIVARKGKDIYAFLAVDKSSIFLKGKTGTFVKAVIKSVKTKKPEYTLGQMNTIISLMNEEKTVAASPLLQDFKLFLEQETVIDDLLNAQYIKKINDLVEKYRNPSAHPGFMSLEKAQKCKEFMPDRIDYLIDCIQ